MSVAVPSLSDPFSATRPERSRAGLKRGLLIGVSVAAVAIFAAALATGRGSALLDALDRAAHADWRFVLAAVVLELLSFASYVGLFHAVFRRASERVDLKASYQITIASTAAARLAPTGGIGGVALTVWALRRAGLARRRVSEDLLGFLVLLYAVYLVALVVTGTLVATGLVGDSEPSGIGLAGAGAGALAIGLALGSMRLRAPADDDEPAGRRPLVLARRGLASVGAGMRRATVLLRTRDVALAGAVGWWAFDVAVLWSTFHALGSDVTPVVLVLGYFLGTLANTVPLPGAVSGGMIGVQVALGAPVAIAVTAVLAYRAIALWLPALVGAHALPGLKRTVARWA